MLLWLKDFNEYNPDVTIHRPNLSTLLPSAFIRGDDEDIRQECWNVGSMNCNFSVTFIKSLNQSSIKPCLSVHLVALWTLKQISFSLLPKIPPGRQAGDFLTCRISNVRLSYLATQTRGDEIIHFRFKGDTTNPSFCFIYLANCNFSFSFPTSGLGLSAILRSLDYNQYLKVLFSYLDPVLINKERSRFVRCWHAKTDGWAASTFHSNCDGRGPTVTIIKVNSYIFGGYTDVSWTSGE